MVQVLDRAFDILELLVSSGDDLSVSEVSARLSLPAGTVHRLLGSLTERGYVTQSNRTRRYGPGPKFQEIAVMMFGSDRFGLQQIARPALERLTEMTGETSNLVVPRGNDGVYLDQVPSAYLVRMFTEIGKGAPLYCTGAGKAILAGYGARQLDDYLATTELEPWTDRTITDSSQLRADLEDTRQRGYALDDEERESGVRCVAAAIFGQYGECLGAISISGPTSRFSKDQALAIGPEISTFAAECSKQLGHRQP